MTSFIVLCVSLISVALTVWVARTLHKNGRVFLIDAFHAVSHGRSVNETNVDQIEPTQHDIH